MVAGEHDSGALTVDQFRQQIRQALRAVAGDAAGLEADLLLREVLQRSRVQLITRGANQLEATQFAQLTTLLKRRQSGEPLAYILGHREFWSLDLLVTPATLIPRPETELLVEIALARVGSEHAQVADLGTGSGAIAIALASERPGWQLLATDQSTAALAVAQQNSQRLQVSNVEFLQGSWFEPLGGRQFDLIISNPPYIADDDPCLEVLLGPAADAHPVEPISALTGGSDGLDDCRQLISAAQNYLKPGGLLLLEHGHDQQPRLQQLLEAAGWNQIECFQDLAGLDRAVLAVAGQ
ncbi:MAG: peptide chain release factor N(5)-glutamine methyltransferase [Immundisolibacteraceae bacterium]|nr:peptide chain release factor N(5)-glutamine methyltransferase [Immundisolibacteraceae bacterium]